MRFILAPPEVGLPEKYAGGNGIAASAWSEAVVCASQVTDLGYNGPVLAWAVCLLRASFAGGEVSDFADAE